MEGDFSPLELRRLRTARKVTFVESLIKAFFGSTALNGTKVDGGFFASHRVLALMSVPLLIALNNKLSLGLTEEQLKWYTGAVMAFIVSKTAEDSMKRSAAIKADAGNPDGTVVPALTEAPKS